MINSSSIIVEATVVFCSDLGAREALIINVSSGFSVEPMAPNEAKVIIKIISLVAVFN